MKDVRRNSRPVVGPELGLRSRPAVLLQVDKHLSRFKCVRSFCRCSQPRPSDPTRAPCVFIYSAFTYAAAAGPHLSPVRPSSPCALLLVSPLIWAGSKTRAWANERTAAGGGAGGVTECLGTCHFASALASTSDLLSL